MRTLKGSFVGLCLILIATTATSQSDPLGTPLEEITRGVDHFATRLVQVLTQSAKENLVLSPVCTDVGLTMITYGAGGKTQNELQHALYLPSVNNETLTGYRHFIDILNETLQLQNTLLVHKTISVKPTYYKLVQNYFHAQIEPASLKNSRDAANIINRSIQNLARDQPLETRDLFTPSDLDDKPDLVLASHVFFKSEWKYKFDPKDTHQKPFLTQKDKNKMVPTMHIIASFKHGNVPNRNAGYIVLPYKEDELYMVILLPNDIDGLTQLEQDLTNLKVSDLIHGGSYDLIDLLLPKFKFQSKLNLNDALSKMGVAAMFSPDADFNVITNDKLEVNRVVHFSTIDLNENGSIIATNSSADFITGGAAAKPVTVSDQPVTFQINHPFHYMIVKQVKNLQGDSDAVILLNGHVLEP